MKKILSMVLVLVLALSCLTVAGVSAADEFTPSEEPVIYFEVPEDWDTYSKIYCHIWSYGGDSFANWQSKKEACTETDTPGIYAYDISNVGTIESGVSYCVIFSADTGMQTYDALFTSECFGDTLYCDSSTFENPEDSNKTALAAYWKNQDKEVYGPVMSVTSIGNIVGNALPEDVTPADLFIDFMTSSKFVNAQTYSGKSDEEIISDVAEGLGLSEDEAAALLASIGMSTTSPDETTPDEYLLGDSDGDGKVNVKDATAIQKYVAGYDITINLDSADADLNGTVNVKDATAIQKYVAGIQVNTPIGVSYGSSEA